MQSTPYPKPHARHMEQMAQLGWRKPTFEEYANWMVQKVRLHTDLAAGTLGKCVNSNAARACTCPCRVPQLGRRICPLRPVVGHPCGSVAALHSTGVTLLTSRPRHGLLVRVSAHMPAAMSVPRFPNEAFQLSLESRMILFS